MTITAQAGGGNGVPPPPVFLHADPRCDRGPESGQREFRRISVALSAKVGRSCGGAMLGSRPVVKTSLDVRMSWLGSGTDSATT